DRDRPGGDDFSIRFLRHPSSGTTAVGRATHEPRAPAGVPPSHGRGAAEPPRALRVRVPTTGLSKTIRLHVRHSRNGWSTGSPPSRGGGIAGLSWASAPAPVSGPHESGLGQPLASNDTVLIESHSWICDELALLIVPSPNPPGDRSAATGTGTVSA